MGVIYILTNPSFPQYVKIGYADDVDKRLKQLNRTECTPFAFRIYATFEVNERLTDIKLHSMIDKINPTLRSIDDVDGKKRVREFYAMTPESAYAIFETMAEITDSMDRLKLYELTAQEESEADLAQEIEEVHKDRLSPFAFSKCGIPVGATLVFSHHGNVHDGLECQVADDKNVIYNGKNYSLSSLATELIGSKHGVAGPKYFKYNGQWLNTIRGRAEGWTSESRVDDVWIVPCNPDLYDIVGAFKELDSIEWSQTTNTVKGDTVYLYVGGKYKSLMYKCEVTEADLIGNRSNNDLKFYKSLSKDDNSRYMILRLIEKYDSKKYPLSELKENGLTSVQGRSRATQELVDYIENK